MLVFLMVLWNMCFMFKEFPSSDFYFRSCQKVLKFEAWPDKYVLKDIKQNCKIVSSGRIDYNVGLYKFIGFNSSKNQPFYFYVAHVDELIQLWHEISGHLNYGKMQLLTKMVHGLPNISSTIGVCEGYVLGKHHSEMFDKVNLSVLKNLCN